MNVLDPKEFIETLLKIKSKEQRIIPFQLNRPQLDFYERRGRRNVMLKARQLGFSTLLLALYYHDTITHEGTNTVLVAQRKEQSAEFLSIMKLFLERTPRRLRPAIRYNNKYELRLGRLNSMIKIVPPTRNAGRGLTIHNLLASEMAFWPFAEETWTALFEAVPESGSITVESTPNGVGNFFHQFYNQAVNGQNSFQPLRYSWERLYSAEWARLKKAEIGPQRWAQEYDCDFLQSARPVFAARHLAQVFAPAHDAKEEEPGLVIYWEPSRSKASSYAIGADTSEGVSAGDFSAATVLDCSTGEEVGHLHGKWPPRVFARKLNDLGRRYGNAVLAVERNNHGHAVLAHLQELGYPTLYHHRDYDAAGRSRARLGWPTTAKTKPILIDELEEAVRLGLIRLHTQGTHDELLVYQWLDTGSTGAPYGYHDDRVMGLAIAWQMRKAGRRGPAFKAPRTSSRRVFGPQGKTSI